MKRYFAKKKETRDRDDEQSKYGVDFLSAETSEDKRKRYRDESSPTKFNDDYDDYDGYIDYGDDDDDYDDHGTTNDIFTLPNGDFLRPGSFNVGNDDPTLLPFLPSESSHLLSPMSDSDATANANDNVSAIGNTDRVSKNDSDDLEYFESQSEFRVPFTSIHSERQYQSITSVGLGPGLVYSRSSDALNGNNGCGDDDNDNDDDLSYDEEEAKVQEFDENTLAALREKDSPFHDDSEKVDVKYNDRNHFTVLTQMYGSVWKHVFPLCVLNVLWCFVIDYIGDNDIADLNIPATGHSFMSMLVAFLVVARVQITYGRFMEARGYLSSCFQSCRELMQGLSVLTLTATNEDAKQWREDIAVQIVASMRVAIAAVEFSSHDINPYRTVPQECLPEDLQKVQDFLSRHTHCLRTKNDEALRAPLVFAGSLRKMLALPNRNGSLGVKFAPPEELRLLGFVTSFCASVHGLSKLITTPFPFPLVQMSRTLLFFWLFTLPMALMTDTAERVQIAVIVFFVTYGFLGLENVSIEIDDPFGHDPNDFNTLHMGQKAYEDIYLTIYQFDGYQHAEQLRQRVSKKTNILGSDKNV